MEATHAAAHAEKAEEGLKELANWITLVTEKAHGTPWAHFLHHWENVIFSWTIALGLALLAFFGTRQKKDVPGPLQNLLETAAEGLVTYVKVDRRPDSIPEDFKTNAMVAALARKPADLGDLPSRPGWHEIKPDPAVSAWTDDYSNIFGAILRKKLGW